MRRILLVLALLALLLEPRSADSAASVPIDLDPPPAAAPATPPVPVNPEIDMDGYLRIANEAAKYREARRLTEDEFIRMSQGKGTVVLDARSLEAYFDLHVKGALHLSFPDIAIASLDSLIPDRNTRILIYCNNNFAGDEQAFAPKLAVASLNLSTFITLYSYGYRDIWELGPRIDLTQTKIEFESTWSR